MGLKFVPSIITLANLVLGIFSLIYSMTQQFQMAAIMVLLCMIMDGVDGKVARKLEASSNFGKELDSLADLVSFGVAPSLLIYFKVLNQFSWIGLVITICFSVAGAIRLARFNVLNISGHFIGVPITAAGSLLAILSLISNKISPYAWLGIVIGLAFLMVSNLKVPKY